MSQNYQMTNHMHLSFVARKSAFAVCDPQKGTCLRLIRFPEDQYLMLSNKKFVFYSMKKAALKCGYQLRRKLRLINAIIVGRRYSIYRPFSQTKTLSLIFRKAENNCFVCFGGLKTILTTGSC